MIEVLHSKIAIIKSPPMELFWTVAILLIKLNIEILLLSSPFCGCPFRNPLFTMFYLNSPSKAIPTQSSREFTFPETLRGSYFDNTCCYAKPVGGRWQKNINKETPCRVQLQLTWVNRQHRCPPIKISVPTYPMHPPKPYQLHTNSPIAIDLRDTL